MRYVVPVIYAELFSHAIRFVYSKQVAEDIVGEIFYRFWEERTFPKSLLLIGDTFLNLYVIGRTTT